MAADREAVRARLRALGFDEVRFARVGGAEVLAPESASLRVWLDAGYHADMAWMERTAEKRTDPRRVLPGARTMIVLGVNYWDGKRSQDAGVRRQETEIGNETSTSSTPSLVKSDKGVGLASNAASVIQNPNSRIQNPRWARYALHADYHDTLKPALVAAGRVLEEIAGAGSADYRYYVDAGPVLERGWAGRAGLGFIGKNAMLISRTHGNWLLLAAVVTTLEFEADEPLAKSIQNQKTKNENPIGLLCGKCTRCLDTCPTQAFAAPGVVDARRCVSYQTIENRGIIPRELRAGIGHRIFGCDVCLEVCPWNRFASAGRRVLLDVRGEIATLTLREILEFSPARFATIFRQTAVKRLKLAGLLRNACVVVGNTDSRDCLEAVLGLALHPLPVVRAHAVWAVFRLGAGDRLAAAHAAETDAAVLAEYAAELGGTISVPPQDNK